MVLGLLAVGILVYTFYMNNGMALLKLKNEAIKIAESSQALTGRVIDTEEQLTIVCDDSINVATIVSEHITDIHDMRNTIMEMGPTITGLLDTVNDISGDVYNLTSHVSVLDENQTVIKESLEEHAAIMIGQKQFAKETYSAFATRLDAINEQSLLFDKNLQIIDHTLSKWSTIFKTVFEPGLTTEENNVIQRLPMKVANIEAILEKMKIEYNALSVIFS